MDPRHGLLFMIQSFEYRVKVGKIHKMFQNTAVNQTQMALFSFLVWSLNFTQP